MNEIDIYAINGVETNVGDKTVLKASNVWNRTKLVEIQVRDSHKVVVRATDLLKAIQNPTNNE